MKLSIAPDLISLTPRFTEVVSAAPDQPFQWFGRRLKNR
jgi:hypothetical protein